MNNSSKLDILYGVRWLFSSLMSIWFGLPHIIQALVILSTTDMFFGACAAIVQGGGFRPKIFFFGITKKTMVLVFCLLGSIASTHLLLEGIDIGFDAGKVVGLYYLVWEITSLIENMGLAGLPVPDSIKSILAQLRKIQGVPDPNLAPEPVKTTATAEIKLTMTQPQAQAAPEKGEPNI